jgi:hypothetical protein
LTLFEPPLTDAETAEIKRHFEDAKQLGAMFDSVPAAEFDSEYPAESTKGDPQVREYMRAFVTDAYDPKTLTECPLFLHWRQQIVEFFPDLREVVGRVPMVAHPHHVASARTLYLNSGRPLVFVSMSELVFTHQMAGGLVVVAEHRRKSSDWSAYFEPLMGLVELVNATLRRDASGSFGKKYREALDKSEFGPWLLFAPTLLLLLHELAHIELGHDLKTSNLSQEKEADDLALDWMATAFGDTPLVVCARLSIRSYLLLRELRLRMIGASPDSDYPTYQERIRRAAEVLRNEAEQPQPLTTSEEDAWNREIDFFAESAFRVAERMALGPDGWDWFSKDAMSFREGSGQAPLVPPWTTVDDVADQKQG